MIINSNDPYDLERFVQAQPYDFEFSAPDRNVMRSGALLATNGYSAHEIFGSPDDMKLQSCARFFANISQKGSVFERVLEQYFRGEWGLKTLSLIKMTNS
ncbi:MAG: DUF1810 domain-containing protein [Nitrosomonas sp.]|nr:DUF1810 domain-containing protein [Nitrosomonas sp.]OQW82342.1 MAG: hypothetical protein BVN30_08905 [Proteobacteria bacterium ST_bin16]